MRNATDDFESGHAFQEGYENDTETPLAPDLAAMLRAAFPASATVARRPPSYKQRRISAGERERKKQQRKRSTISRRKNRS